MMYENFFTLSADIQNYFVPGIKFKKEFKKTDLLIISDIEWKRGKRRVLDTNFIQFLELPKRT